MEESEFWAIIDRSREGGDDQEAALEQLLTGRTREVLQAFERIYTEQLARAYRWDLWGAGYIINGGMSDDSFDYFCDWLIGRGREVFERALADPESLADVPEAAEGDVEAEGLRYAVLEAYEATHGEAMELPPTSYHSGGPAGEEWDEGEVNTLYPRLAEKFG